MNTTSSQFSLQKFHQLNLKTVSRFTAKMLLSLSIFTGQLAFAEAPSADVGTFDSNVEYGVIFNGGLAIGGDAALELSVGTVHGDSSADSFNASVTQASGIGLGLGGASAELGGIIFNGGLVVGGDMCAKTAVASLGASTCTYGNGTFSAESE